MNEVEEFLSNEPIKIIKDEIIIDNEIQNRLWKLTEEEKEKLKQSIIDEGCRESLILWNNTLVDGHNRYEICKAFDINYKTVKKHFNNKNEVLKWVDNNQLSRRNLTDEQRSILRGRLSKSNKQEVGGDRKSLRQNVAMISQQNIADELGVNRKTLQRDEKYFDAYENIIKNVGKDNADELIKKLPKKDIVSIVKENPEKQKSYINKILIDGITSLKEAKKIEQINDRKINVEIQNHLFNSFELDKLYFGNSVEILKTFPDNIVDCVVMDPPWGVDYKDSRESFNPDYNDDKEYALKILDDVCLELKRITKSDAHIYCVFAMENYIEFYNILSKYFKIEKVPLIWKKNNHTLRDFNKGYAYLYEPLFFGTDRTRLLNNKISRNILDYDIPKNKLHKAQKPVDLLEYLIKNSTVEGEVVLDPFMGSGSTCVAAKKSNRKYLGIEIEADSFNIAKDFLKKESLKNE